jgi:membrane-associated phospholipid phosphatase
MNALSGRFPHRAPVDSDRAIRLTSALVGAYLAITIWPMALYARSVHAGTPLFVHLAILLFAIAITRSRARYTRPLRDLLPLAVGPFLYVELRWLILGTGRPHVDQLVRSWELTLFPTNPSTSWAPSVPSVALSEALHLAYASYYLLVLVPPVLLLLRGERDAYAGTVLALALTYSTCFITYLIFPVDGPRYLLGPAAAPDGPVRTFVLNLLAVGSSRGTAFPSSHVAASVVATLCAMRYQRRVGLVLLPFSIALALGTVYGGFHYAVDAVVGAGVGFACWALSMWLTHVVAVGRTAPSTAVDATAMRNDPAVASRSANVTASGDTD